MKPPALVVFVTGSRDWCDESAMLRQWKYLPTNTWLVHGGCGGADLMADRVAKSFGWQTIRMDANWDYHGRRIAGPIRNTAMAAMLATIRAAGLPIKAFAFHDDLEHSKGTGGMVRLLKRLGIEYTNVISGPAEIMRATRASQPRTEPSA